MRTINPSAGPTPLSAFVAGTLVWLVGLLGPAVASDAIDVLDQKSDIRPPCCRALKPGTALPDKSLYQLESDWTSDVGRRVRLGVLQGRPQVVAMVFTQCEFACPIIVNDMKRIEAALPENVRTNVGFLLVSLDHERDTPEKLHAFRTRMGLPNERWTLLRGGADDVREFAALLGVNYRKDARGQYAHSNIISVLNPGGEIVLQESGLNISTDEPVRKLKALVP